MADDRIEPTHYDAVVISSGLPEVLLASALASAGKAVLLLDAHDAYGGSWASLSGGDFVHSLLNTSLRAKQQHQQGEGDGTSIRQAPADVSAACTVVQQDAPLARAQHAATLVKPQLQEALQDRGLIVDLTPRVLYQDEPLVQLLVSLKAHHYIEFKLVEGNYIYQRGGLRPVPASRADLFADRVLSLADKRSLGRFLAACMEALEGGGRLKDAFDEGTPLVQLLAAEGLPEHLQQVVLYGIAMAHTPQAQQTAQQTQQPGPQQQQDSNNTTRSSTVSAAQGLAALQLYSRSVGRYGASAAFMAPCYGSGSLIEAFVRAAAVKGAVTALRHGTTQLQAMPEPHTQAAGHAQAAAAPAREGAAADTSGSAGQPPAGTATATAGDGGTACGSGPPTATAPPRINVVLSSGQRITAGAVISDSSSLQHPGRTQQQQAGSGGGSMDTMLAHAVAVLDGSLVQDTTSLLLVVPPGALGPQQTAVIRGLQLGPAQAVAPPQHYLLYLSAVVPCAAPSPAAGAAAAGAASAPTAQQVLQPALEALACLQGLQPFNPAEQQQPVDAGTSTVQQGCADAAAGSASAASSSSSSSSRQQAGKPSVLAACFYSLQHSRGGTGHAQQQHVIACEPAAAPGFAGYSSSVDAAAALFRQHFPGVPWLSDPAAPQLPTSRQAPAAGAGADGAAAAGSEDAGASGAADTATAATAAAAAAAMAGQGASDDELDAIDELAAALAELSSSIGGAAPPAPEAAATAAAAHPAVVSEWQQ